MGSAVNASTVQLEPGLWSLRNWGDVLVATIANGKTYAWDASASSRLSIRASRTTCLQDQVHTKFRILDATGTNL